jgi:hypothetical protein
MMNRPAEPNEKTLSIPDAYEVFLKVGADPEVL